MKTLSHAAQPDAPLSTRKGVVRSAPTIPAKRLRLVDGARLIAEGERPSEVMLASKAPHGSSIDVGRRTKLVWREDLQAWLVEVK